MDWKKLFFSADGRIGRQEFWIGFLVLLGAGVVFNFIPLIGQLLGLVSIWCWICLYSKRLHDMGKSGWLQIIPIGVGFAAVIMAAISGGAAIFAAAMQGDSVDPATLIAGLGAAALFLGAAGLVGLVFLLWIGLSGSQPGQNRYDPIPEVLPEDAPEAV